MPTYTNFEFSSNDKEIKFYGVPEKVSWGENLDVCFESKDKDFEIDVKFESSNSQK